MALDADDLLQFFDPDMPGVVEGVVLTPAAGGATTIFTARVRRGGASGIAMLGESELVIQFIAADVPNIAQGDKVTVGATDYTLRGPANDLRSADGRINAYAIREAA